MTVGTEELGVLNELGVSNSWYSVTNEGNGLWIPSTVPGNPNSTTELDAFESVSCTSASNCTAVGYNGTNNSFEGALDGLPEAGTYDTEVDGNWGTPAALAEGSTFTKNSGLDEELVSVSCSNATNCTAVGSQGFPNSEPSVATETNGVWSTFSVLPYPTEAYLKVSVARVRVTAQPWAVLAMSTRSTGMGPNHRGTESLRERIPLAH